jgi:hypothetical protein
MTVRGAEQGRIEYREEKTGCLILREITHIGFCHRHKITQATNVITALAHREPLLRTTGLRDLQNM